MEEGHRMTAATLQGIVPDLPELEYHSHPALSSTGARKLLDSPARYQWAQNHPEPQKDAFDLGHAVHKKILGVGAHVIEYPEEHLTPSGNASTKAATVEWVEEQRANGLVVISATQAALVNGMTEAVLAHPKARMLLEDAEMVEASVFATDPDAGVDMRARFDYIGHRAGDLKTARDASPDGFARSAAEYRYDVQQEWYRLAYAIAARDTMPFDFIVVESHAPYLVAVYELDIEFVQMGRRKVREALDTYAACVASGVWPGYPVDAEPLLPPAWLLFREGEMIV
jgi:hypothetical protein